MRGKGGNFSKQLLVKKIEIASIAPEVVLTLQRNENKVRFQLKYQLRRIQENMHHAFATLFS